MGLDPWLASPARTCQCLYQKQDGRHVRSPQHSSCCVYLEPMYIPPMAPHLNSCHGDQALIPTEYSDDDVESSCWGGNGAHAPCLCLSLAVLATPCFPIPSLCFFPPKPQVPGSEVEIWLAPGRVRRGQGDQESYISAGVPSGWWGQGGVRALTTQHFIFQCPPTTSCPAWPARPCLASALPSASLAALARRHGGFPWCLGPGRHLLIRIQYTPHPQTQARIL